MSNIQFTLTEKTEKTENNDYYASYYAQLKLNYNLNYTKQQLIKIAEYYNIPKRKKRKDELITDIVLFEIDKNNISMTLRRQRLWEYLNELKEDKYLSKYILNI